MKQLKSVSSQFSAVSYQREAGSGKLKVRIGRRMTPQPKRSPDASVVRRSMKKVFGGVDLI
jgi:hypothetical protein